MLKRMTKAAAIGIGIALYAPPSTFAQAYPSKTIHVLVAGSPGSGTDLVTRILAAKMSENWRQPFVVENRPGGSGAVAGTALVKAPPDGHTLMAFSDAHAVNAALNAPALPYDSLRDIARVAMVASFPSVLVVPPSLSVSSVPELIALGRAKPGKLSFGSAGVGGGLHLSGEMFKLGAGIDAVHVPYKGPLEALGDMMSGRIDYMFSTLGPTLPHIRSGRVRALAVSSQQRSPQLPEVPTLAEAALPGFEYQLWAGWFAPANTPRAILEQISREVARIMNLPEVREQMANQNMMYRDNTPDEFDRFVHAEVERLRGLAHRAGIKLQ
jgi:tripartite-type tricarboxylate transporter receptor subunit TctC